MMYDKWPAQSSYEQTIALNELLGADESYFTVTDLFNILPQDITYMGHRGYLQISSIDISWTSVDSSWKLNVVYAYNIMPNMNIFDAFIKAIEWLDENKDKITINGGDNNK